MDEISKCLKMYICTNKIISFFAVLSNLAVIAFTVLTAFRLIRLIKNR